MASDIEEITRQLIAFRDERDWEQFHNAKDLAIAIGAESGELLECFLWKAAEEAKTEKIKEELADVLAYSFLLAHRCGLNVREIMEEKIKRNALKYPIEKAKGSAKKYDEL